MAATTDALVIPGLRLDKGEGLAEALRCLREFDPRIFLIQGGDPEDLSWFHETLEDQADHPILFCSPLERGAGQEIEGLMPLPDAWALGLLGEEACHEAGHRTAAEAATAQIRWILGPCLDLHSMELGDTKSPIVGHRAFGGHPEKVTACARAWATGVADAGGIACGMHFPGHGASSQDTFFEAAVCFEEDIENHLSPFRDLIEALPSIMIGHIEYPFIDDQGRPASRSPVFFELLRERWGYQGIVVTDSLQKAGFGEPREEMAVEAVRAGADLLLDPPDPVATALSLRFAQENGELNEERIASAVKRIDGLFALAEAEPARPKPLVLGGGTKSLIKPLPGGSGGRSLPRPSLALGLAPTRDAVNFLENFGIPVVGPDFPPPDEFPDTLLVLLGAVPGKGQIDIPEDWLEAIHAHHPVIYVAGSPDAPEKVPASSRGWSLPGVSPTLLGLLLTEGGEEELA